MEVTDIHEVVFFYLEFLTKKIFAILYVVRMYGVRIIFIDPTAVLTHQFQVP